jgi:hypothetical protein
VYVFLRAPWVQAQVIKLTERYEKDTLITVDRVAALAKKTLKIEETMLEAVVVRTEINGYPAKDIVGKSGHMLSVYVLLTTVDSDLQETVQHNVEQAFPHSEIRWRSHTRALLQFIHDSYLQSRDTLVVDISSEGTSIFVVQDGILEKQITLDFGVHAILAKLSPNALPDETLGLIRMLEREQCSSEACDTLRSNIEKTEQHMIKIYGEQLANLAGKTRLPISLLLSVHPDCASWLNKFFSKLDFAQFTIPLQPFSVIELSAKDFYDTADIKSNTADISTLLAASLVHREIVDKK